MNEILSLNLKKFRVSQKLTQEQAAEALDVSAQTISRWECGNTLPEATKLPEIARLYSVTIDDLFKQHAVAYQNYAQRLAAVYESSHRSEDFISAEREFHSLIDSGNYTPDDMRLLGVTYQFMMTSCAENALYWFDRVLREEDAAGPELCHRTRLQKMRLLAQLGKGDEAVEQQLAAVHDHPHSAENRALLVAAYVYANRYEEAFACTAEALSEFPEEWELYVHAVTSVCIWSNTERRSPTPVRLSSCVPTGWMQNTQWRSAMKKWGRRKKQPMSIWRSPPTSSSAGPRWNPALKRSGRDPSGKRTRFSGCDQDWFPAKKY